MSYKYKICIVLFFEILSRSGSPLPVPDRTDYRILRLYFSATSSFALSKRTAGILSTFGRVMFQDLQLLCILFFQKLHGILQESGLHCHDIFKLSMYPISKSREVYSFRCLLVLCFSARNTGAVSNTRSNTPTIICL